MWYIPDGGLATHLSEWLIDLHGHKRRVGYIEWHPTAENILVSAGFDHLVSEIRINLYIMILGSIGIVHLSRMLGTRSFLDFVLFV